MTNNYCKNECYNYKLCKALGNVPNDLTAFESCNFAIDKSRIVELPMKTTIRLHKELTDYCKERCIDEL